MRIYLSQVRFKIGPMQQFQYFTDMGISSFAFTELN